MCGRTSFAISWDEVPSRFNIEPTPAAEEYVPNYNISPGEGLITVTDEEPGTADVFDWGFIPSWADDPDEVPNPINARSETVADSNMFRSAFKNHRCLVLADGFYEWQGSRGSKQPYRICRADREVFAFAGLWSRWEPPNGGDPRTSTTILTTDANAVVEPIHDRMPVILEPDEEDVWLRGDPDDAHGVLDPFPDSALDAYPVSKRVSNPANDGPELFEEIDISEQSGLGDFGG